MYTRAYLQAKLNGPFDPKQATVLADIILGLQGDAEAVADGLTTLAAKLNADAANTALDDTDYAGVTLTSQGL